MGFNHVLGPLGNPLSLYFTNLERKEEEKKKKEDRGTKVCAREDTSHQPGKCGAKPCKDCITLCNHIFSEREIATNKPISVL